MPELALRASEVDLPALGVNISNDDLVGVLLDLVRARPEIELIEAEIVDYELGATAARAPSPAST